MRVDVPVGVVQWEVFLPKQYAVAAFGGDAIPANLMPAAADLEEFAELRPGSGNVFVNAKFTASGGRSGGPGGFSFAEEELGGNVVDQAGAALRGATVVATNVATGATRTAVADANGNWSVFKWSVYDAKGVHGGLWPKVVLP